MKLFLQQFSAIISPHFKGIPAAEPHGLDKLHLAWLINEPKTMMSTDLTTASLRIHPQALISLGGHLRESNHLFEQTPPAPHY